MVIYIGTRRKEKYLPLEGKTGIGKDGLLPLGGEVSLMCNGKKRFLWVQIVKLCHRATQFFKSNLMPVRTNRHLLATLCFFIVLLAIRIVLHECDGSWTEDSVKKESLVNTLEKNITDLLRAPPSISRLLPMQHFDGKELIVPKDYQRPYVYSAVGVPVRDVGSDTQSLLFLYSQGTLIWSDSVRDMYLMNVTSCLVGANRFPVIYDASGVYTCAISRTLEEGELLSLIVSPSVWRQQPSIDERRAFMHYLTDCDQQEDGSLILQSSLKWGRYMMEMPPLEDEGRYRVCMMTQEKNFPEYIPEWIAYHRRVGVDYVYIYDNQAAGDLSKLYQNAEDVEIVNWPWQRSQLQAQNHFLLTGRRRCEWALLIDVDEYLMIRSSYLNTEEQPLKKYLRLKRESQDFSQIRVTSVALGSSGYTYRPHDPVAEAYWHRANLQDNLTKPIVWVGHTLPNSSVHRIDMAPAYYSETTTSALEKPESAKIALCHMKYRSWEDYVMKGRGGRNSFQVEEWFYSSNWSVHNPSRNHLTIRNAGTFLEFRQLWRRLIRKEKQAPQLGPFNEAKLRSERIRRKGYVWKRRRNFGNTTLLKAIIEEEECFRRLKRWEIKKRDRLRELNITIEY